MTFRTWIYVLVVAVIIATAALVIANVYGFSGSELVLLLLDVMWIVGLAGTVASLVAMMALSHSPHRRPRAWGSSPLNDRHTERRSCST